MLAGIMAIHTFPLDRECFLDLLRRVDVIVIWLDQQAKHRRPEFSALIRNHGGHLLKSRILDAKQPWKKCSCYLWREPLMRALDDIRPAYVLQPDSDERFADNFPRDLFHFRQSGKDLLMFDYSMPTADGAIVPTIPRARHCKAIRWQPNLSFTPYHGYGRPTPAAGQLSEMVANSKIQHYCFYTPELQREKVARMTAAQRDKFGHRSPLTNHR